MCNLCHRFHRCQNYLLLLLLLPSSRPVSSTCVCRPVGGSDSDVLPFFICIFSSQHDLTQLGHIERRNSQKKIGRGQIQTLDPWQRECSAMLPDPFLCIVKPFADSIGVHYSMIRLLMSSFKIAVRTFFPTPWIIFCIGNGKIFIKMMHSSAETKNSEPKRRNTFWITMPYWPSLRGCWWRQ